MDVGSRASRGEVRATKLRAAIATALLLGAVAVIVAAVTPPLGQWLFFRYATYWLAAALLLACSGSLGLGVVHALAGYRVPLVEQLAMALPVGLLGFVHVWWCLGMLGQFSRVTFFVVPLACLAVGARTTLRLARRVYRHRRLFRAPASLGTQVAIACGAIAIALLYVAILTPGNVSYDSRWYHMAAAESYAVTGRVVRFREGWILGAFPQLATLLYTWAFLLPGAALFDKVEVSAHLEFAIFLATLSAIPVLVRRVVPRGVQVPGATWVAFFFFPGIYVYDSNLNAGADHIAALWGVPIFLAFLRLVRELEFRRSILFAILVAGALNTKFTAFSLVVFPAMAVAFRVAWLAGRQALGAPRSKSKWLASACAMTGVVVVLWAPVWLKNLVWYRDPLFPMLHSVFRSSIWSPNAAAQMEDAFTPKAWSPEHSFSGVLATLKSLYSFSFKPNDWYGFHRDVPVFGFLFTLTVPLLVLFRRSGRLLMLYASVHVGLLFWYWTAHQDRYLQVLVPLMASGVASVLLTVWRLGIAPKLAVVLLVGLQVVWGGDLPFIGGPPIRASIDFLSSGYRRDWVKRFETYGEWTKIRRALPKGAVVLLHDVALHLGIGRETVSDWYQTGIDYVEAPAPSRVYDVLHALGVTHLLVRTDDFKTKDTTGGELAFWYFATRFGEHGARYGGYRLLDMPKARPKDDSFKDRALYLGCGDTYANGLYAISGLNRVVNGRLRPARGTYPPPMTPLDPGANLAPMIDSVDAIVHKPSCFPTHVNFAKRGFTKVTSLDGHEVWIR